MPLNLSQQVRDTMDPVDMRAHGRAIDERSKVQRVGLLSMPPALKNQGMQSSVSFKPLRPPPFPPATF